VHRCYIGLIAPRVPSSDGIVGEGKRKRKKNIVILRAIAIQLLWVNKQLAQRIAFAYRPCFQLAIDTSRRKKAKNEKQRADDFSP